MDNLAYQMSVCWEEGIMKIAITGQVSKENSTEIALSVCKVINEHKPSRVLVDTTRAVGRLGIVDRYDHVHNYPLESYRPEKVAILEHLENKEMYSFHETVAANRGFSMKYFHNANEALEWVCV